MDDTYSRRQYKVSVPLKKNPLSYGVPTFKKKVTVYHFYGVYTLTVYTLTIFTRHLSLTPPKSTNEKSRSNRRTRAKLARREAINRREEHKQSTD